MPRINYSSQQMIKGLSVPDTITIVGTGGFGAWLAILAAMAGVRKLILFDHGKVKDTDIARLPFSPSNIGKRKVDVLRQQIIEIRPDAQVEVQGRFEPNRDAALLEGVVFAGADNLEIERRLAKLTSTRKLRFVSGVYSGLDVGVFTFSPRHLRVMPGPAPVWVGSSVLVATLALYSACSKPINFFGAPSKFKMRRQDVEEALSLTGVPTTK